MTEEQKDHYWKQLVEKIKDLFNYQSSQQFDFDQLRRELQRTIIETLQHAQQEGNLQRYKKYCESILPRGDEHKDYLLKINNLNEFNKYIHEPHPAEIMWVCSKRTLKHIFTSKKYKTQPRTKNLFAILYGESDDFLYYCISREGEKPGDVMPHIKTTIQGQWTSIVRSNDGQHLLFAKVEVVMNQKKELQLILHGKERSFQGTIHIKNGCLQAYVENEDKNLLLNFRLGNARNPQLLQGTFSGINTNGDPIAGLELLLRPQQLPEVFSNLPLRIDMHNPEPIWQLLDERIRELFKDFNRCYLKVPTPPYKIANFDLTDLN